MNKQKHNKHNCENFNFWLGNPRIAGQLNAQTSDGHTELLKVRSLKAFNKLFLPAADILFQFQSTWLPILDHVYSKDFVEHSCIW